MDKESPAFNIAAFKTLVEQIKVAGRQEKAVQIQDLLSFPGLLIHFHHRQTKRVVVAECEIFEFAHELHTAKKLTGQNYDVLLMPKGYFKRNEKRFDVFLARGHIMLAFDLKAVTSINPLTIGDRINEGSEQASRLVLDIRSGVEKNVLIDGLRNGAERNKTLLKILLFYRSRFYELPKDLILSRNIYKAIE